ncbi:MAG: hypothetical protein WDZ83_00240 [Rhizobiaceae bacterium]
METIPLKDTAKLGKIGKRVEPDEQESAEKRWERELESLPDVEATVERISGALPWTHAVEFENADGERERWLLRGFSPFTQSSE